MSQETVFKQTLCTVMLLLTSGFFQLQNVFFQTMLTYIPLELQFSADHSFLGNYALKMYGVRDTGGQSPR